MGPTHSWGLTSQAKGPKEGAESPPLVFSMLTPVLTRTVPHAGGSLGKRALPAH